MFRPKTRASLLRLPRARMEKARVTKQLLMLPLPPPRWKVLSIWPDKYIFAAEIYYFDFIAQKARKTHIIGASEQCDVLLECITKFKNVIYNFRRNSMINLVTSCHRVAAQTMLCWQCLYFLFIWKSSHVSSLNRYVFDKNKTYPKSVLWFRCGPSWTNPRICSRRTMSG